MASPTNADSAAHNGNTSSSPALVAQLPPGHSMELNAASSLGSSGYHALGDQVSVTLYQYLLQFFVSLYLFLVYSFPACHNTRGTCFACFLLFACYVRVCVCEEYEECVFIFSMHVLCV
jgi:prolipoprotein diacylglyceryltransferase